MKKPEHFINRALEYDRISSEYCDVSFRALRFVLCVYFLFHTPHKIKMNKTVRKYFFNLIFHSFEYRHSCKIVAFADTVSPLRCTYLFFFALVKREYQNT